jgi:hypothetical protein
LLTWRTFHLSNMRLRDDRDRATNVLRNIMLTNGQKRFVYGDTLFELRPSVEYWCCEHSQPPYYCRDLHDDGNPVQVREVAVAPYLRITPKKDR